MNVGMLWFDNDTKSDLETRVSRAVIYYQKKYGKHPNLCFVHPSMAKNLVSESLEHPIVAGEVEIRTTRSVLPNHFWIGVNGLNGNANA